VRRNDLGFVREKTGVNVSVIDACLFNLIRDHNPRPNSRNPILFLNRWDGTTKPIEILRCAGFDDD